MKDVEKGLRKVISKHIALVLDLKGEKGPKLKNMREIADQEVVVASAKALRQNGTWNILGSKMRPIVLQRFERKGK